VHVLKKDAYLKIPVLYQNIAISDIKVNGRPALVVAEGGYHKVIIANPGEYTVTAEFAVKSSLDRGPNNFNFSIQQTPITVLRLELPLKEVEVDVSKRPAGRNKICGQHYNCKRGYCHSRIQCNVGWRKKVAAADKIPPKLYSEIYHLISIDDDALKINSDINYNILHSEINSVQIVIPDNVNVLSVSGDGVGEWQEISKNDQRIILVPFTYGKKGNVTVRVNSESPLTENGLANLFSGFRTTETVRETGFIGVELNTSAEVVVGEVEGLKKSLFKNCRSN
jgi:hypothetical protein